jgi:hypothetical protein
MGLTFYCDYERKGFWNLLVYEGIPIGEQGDGTLHVVEAANLIEDYFLYLIHGLGFHLDYEVIDTVKTIDLDDLLDSFQGFDYFRLLPEFCVKKNESLHSNHMMICNTGIYGLSIDFASVEKEACWLQLFDVSKGLLLDKLDRSEFFFY